MKSPEPFHVLHAQKECERPSAKQEQSCQQSWPDGRGDTSRPVASQEIHHALADGGPGAVDEEICTCAEAFEIGDDILVERNGARHRQGRNRLPIEARQGCHIVVAERFHAGVFSPCQDQVQFAPVGLTLFAEAVGFEKVAHSMSLCLI